MMTIPMIVLGDNISAKTNTPMQLAQGGRQQSI
jgi:hypothetical protein